MWLTALWFACGTSAQLEPSPTCQPAPLEAGEVRARRIQCSDEILPSGEARQGDWLLENAQVRLAIRDATVSLTQLQGTGGTIIDAALPEGSDALVEIIPRVGEHWFVNAEIEAWSTDDAAGLRVLGVLPGGEEAEVGYTLTADSVELELTGMDGITMVPMTNSEAVGSGVETPVDGDWLLFLADGAIEDLGGWIRWDAPTAVHIGPRSAVHAAAWPAGRGVDGTSNGDWIHVRHLDTVLARFPVVEDQFSGWVPAQLDGLQAVASDTDPGPTRPARFGQDLPTGDKGAIALSVIDQNGDPLPATLSWNGVSHPWLPGDGALGVGPGVGSGTVSAGAAYDALEIPEQTISGTVILEAQLTRQIGDALLARLDVVGAPDPSERRSSERVLHAEAAAGVRWAVLLADDEIPRVSLSEDTQDWIHGQAGSRSGGPNGSPVTWPWSTDTDAPAHGAAPWHLLDPLDMLDVMTKAGSRRAVIDAGWVAAAGEVVSWGMRPEAFRIDSLDDLPVYTELLDHWIPLAAVGPWTWIEDIQEEEYSTTEAVRGILAGRTTATTGPRLVLTVNGTGPGELLHDSGIPTKRIRLQVEAAAGFAPTHAAVLTDAGELQRWEIEESPPSLLDVQTEAESPNWVLAIAWSEGTDGPWAVSAPVWVGRP